MIYILQGIIAYVLIEVRKRIKKRLGVEFWVFAWNYAYVLFVLENLVELVSYGLGCMFGELLPIHLRIVNPVVSFFWRE
jgi:hypothetical protein